MTTLVGFEEFSSSGTGENDILLLGLKRVNDGLRIKAKSAAFEEFFIKGAEQQAQKTKTMRLFGQEVKVHAMPLTPVRVKDASLDAAGDTILIEEFIPNLTFLRMVGLKDGISIIVPCVVSIPQMDSFGKACRRAAQELFESYMLPYGKNLRMYVREEKVA